MLFQFRRSNHVKWLHCFPSAFYIMNERYCVRYVADVNDVDRKTTIITTTTTPPQNQNNEHIFRCFSNLANFSVCSYLTFIKYRRPRTHHWQRRSAYWNDDDGGFSSFCFLSLPYLKISVCHLTFPTIYVHIGEDQHPSDPPIRIHK